MLRCSEARLYINLLITFKFYCNSRLFYSAVKLTLLSACDEKKMEEREKWAFDFLLLDMNTEIIFENVILFFLFFYSWSPSCCTNFIGRWPLLEMFFPSLGP